MVGAFVTPLTAAVFLPVDLPALIVAGLALAIWALAALPFPVLDFAALAFPVDDGFLVELEGLGVETELEGVTLAVACRPSSRRIEGEKCGI